MDIREEIGPDDDLHFSLEELREMPAWRKMQITFELTERHHQRIREELKSSFPQVSDDELRRRYIARILPREDVIAAFKFDPLAEGYEMFQQPL